MPGPGTVILLPRPVAPNRVRQLLQAKFIAVHKEGELDPDLAFDGWIEERPFIASCGFVYKRELDELDFDGFVRAFGWSPVDQVVVSAMCDSDEDHRLLARICAIVALEFGGAVSLDRLPHTMTEAVRRELEGKLVRLRQFEDGEPKGDDPDWFCDATFIASWARHPDCRLVK
jgi:hypothetical protein